VLGEGEAGVEELHELGHPRLALPAEIGRGHEGVLAAEPLDGDRERVERGPVEVGAADALDELERVVAGRYHEIGLGG
jgi:hypothetical protein